MDELISRQAAIDEAEEWIGAVYCEHEEQRERSAIKKVIQGIKALPSAEPEIIYCKDCKYRNPFIKDTATMWLPCMAIDTDDKWFCGYGE